MSKQDRAEAVNKFLRVIGGCGRRFFFHSGAVSFFEIDQQGRVWFVDSWKGLKIYTHRNFNWKGFHEGGTLFDLVKHLRDYIRTGDPQPMSLGPWPDWVCGGDLWGYGDDMEQVRSAAQECGFRLLQQTTRQTTAHQNHTPPEQPMTGG